MKRTISSDKLRTDAVAPRFSNLSMQSRRLAFRAAASLSALMARPPAAHHKHMHAALPQEVVPRSVATERKGSRRSFKVRKSSLAVHGAQSTGHGNRCLGHCSLLFSSIRRLSSTKPWLSAWHEAVGALPDRTCITAFVANYCPPCTGTSVAQQSQ